MPDNQNGKAIPAGSNVVDWFTIQGLVQDCAPADYYAMHSALGSASTAEDAQDDTEAVMRILSNICFLHFDPSSRNSPYTPAVQLGDRRSFSVDDLTPENLMLLDSEAEKISRPDLRARVYDILWLKRRDLGVRTALSAIKAYSALELPAESGANSHAIVECWERALNLARLIRGAGTAAVESLEEVISGALSQALVESDTLARELSRLSIHYGLDEELRDDRAQALRRMADQFRDDGQHFAERVFLEAASDWEAAAHGRSVGFWGIVDRIAASHELEARLEEESSEPNFVRIATVLEQAIQQFRRIPRQYRADGFDLHVENLRKRLMAAGVRAVEEMELVQSEAIDLTDMAERAKELVVGRTALEALLGLIVVFPIPSRNDLIAAEQALMAQGSLIGVFPKATLHEDGRVIAKVPAAGVTVDEDVVVIRAIENLTKMLEAVVNGAIVPALGAFNQEHCMRERELLPLVANSAAVPPGREFYFAKGLAAGFDWDFITSSHLLVPQLEAFLRYHIKGRGGDTTILSAEGIHTEASLGSLLEMELTVDILGPDLSFLFEALLVSPHGPNLRNVQAHGLIEPHAAGGVHSVYVWWLCLHLVVLPFWASGKSKENPEAE